MSDKPVIWSAWFQGRDKAPRHVQRILRVWEDLNPDRRLHVVEAAEADAILERLGVRQSRISPQVKADIVRSVLLKELGGVWVDSTLLPMVPLSKWLDDLLAVAGFFAFRSSGDPNLVLQNWFLASEANNPLMSRWCDFYVDYFRTPRYWATWKRAIYHIKVLDYIKHVGALRRRDTLWFVDPDRGRGCFFHPYAIHNYNLAYLLHTNAEIRGIWEQIPVRWNNLPQLAGRIAADPETPFDAFTSILREVLPHAPVHKLNHRDQRFNAIVTVARELLGLPSD
jgi:hypothetical protein